MSKNRSPWIHQLDKTRPIEKLKEDIETDIVVVGGGIAGVSTAFFLLKYTKQQVVLVEGGQLGHGATGHNAGQVTSYLARPLHDLAKEFGEKLATEAQRHIEEDGWELLSEIYTEAKLDIPLSRFVGHLGISNKEHVISYLRDNAIRQRAGLKPKEILIVEGADFIPEIQPEFASLYRLAKQSEILARLETRDEQFIACLSEQKGCMNSALFTEETAKYLLSAYKTRFKIFEHAHIKKIVLHDTFALLDAEAHTLKCERVVLATNGFDNLSIFNKSGLDIDTNFHHLIDGVIGYMSGYLDKPLKPPVAISYFTDTSASLDAPYIYLTRRVYEYNTNQHNLISIGGPELDLENRREYERDHEYPDWAKDEIDKFVREIYLDDKKQKIEYEFTWHGLMGYTPNRVRRVGPEPLNPVLLYNLGCNGVGILPSIFGGRRISQFINGERLASSIFDPHDQGKI